MPVTIFRTETNARETSLIVDDDETVTYHIENSGWPMMKSGINERRRQLSVNQAIAEWPSYANDIAKALNTIRKNRQL